MKNLPLKLFAVVVGLFLLSCQQGCNRKESLSTDKTEEPVVVDLFPVEKEEKLTVVKRAVSSLDEPVTFVVRNNSEEEFSYFGLGRHGEYSLQVCVVRLYRDGEQIPLNRPLVELRAFSKNTSESSSRAAPFHIRFA